MRWLCGYTRVISLAKPESQPRARPGGARAEALLSTRLPENPFFGQRRPREGDGERGGLRVVFHPASRLTRAPARRLLSSSGYGVAWALYRSDLQQVWPEVWPFGFYLTAAVEFQQPSTGFSCQFGANVLRPQDPTYDGRADGSTAGVRPHEGRKNERVGRRLNALRPAVSLPVWSLSPTGT